MEALEAPVGHVSVVTVATYLSSYGGAGLVINRVGVTRVSYRSCLTSIRGRAAESVRNRRAGRSGPVNLGTPGPFWRRTVKRLPVGGLVAALLASSLLVMQTSHAESLPSVEAPLAFGGTVTKIASLALADITVLVEPRAETVGAMQVGDRMEMHVLPEDVVRVDGNRYTVEVDPATIPAENIAADGLVTFRIDVLSAGDGLFGSALTSVRAFTPSGSDQAGWIDPLEYLGEADGTDVDPAPSAEDYLEGNAAHFPDRVADDRPNIGRRKC